MIFRSLATALFCSAGVAFAQAPATEPAPAEDSLFIDFEKAIETVVKNNADIQEAKFLWRSNAELASGAYGDFEPHLVGRLNKERGDSPSALFTETKDEYKLGVQGKLPTGTEYNAGFNQATYTHSDYTSELYFGAYNSERPERNVAILQAFLQNFQMLTITDGVARLFGQLKASLRRQSVQVAPFDLMIGSIALENGCRVATGNVRHFRHIKKLTLCDWIRGTV